MSRLEILNNLAKKWSRVNTECVPVDSFDEWLLYYDSEATIKLVCIAMDDYYVSCKNLKNGND